jgi:plastocyanin
MADRQLRTRIIRALGGAVVVGALVGSGTALAADQAVAISGFSFSPASVTVSVGDTVTWTNSDAQAHTATADDASWDTGTIAGSGATGAVTFTIAGAYPYHCSIHPTMTGTVTVQAAAPTPAPTARATTPPTDTAPTAATDPGSAEGSLAALAIAAIALAVATAVVRRRPASTR